MYYFWENIIKVYILRSNSCQNKKDIMSDVIDNTLVSGVQRGLRLEALHRYIRMKYGISIDLDALKRRIHLLNLKLDY